MAKGGNLVWPKGSNWSGFSIHLRNEKPAESIPAKGWLERLDELLKSNLDHLRKEFNELKRGIRKLKVKQKISGCFRSDVGADAFHAIHSIVDTAWKNKQSPLEAIIALV